LIFSFPFLRLIQWFLLHGFFLIRFFFYALRDKPFSFIERDKTEYKDFFPTGILYYLTESVSDKSSHDFLVIKLKFGFS